MGGEIMNSITKENLKQHITYYGIKNGEYCIFSYISKIQHYILIRIVHQSYPIFNYKEDVDGNTLIYDINSFFTKIYDNEKEAIMKCIDYHKIRHDNHFKKGKSLIK